MTFKEWEKSAQGQGHFDMLINHSDILVNSNIDDLMWIQYNSSDYYQQDQGIPKLMGVVKTPEDLNLLTANLKKYTKDTLQNIDDLQLKDAKENLNRILEALNGYTKIADVLRNLNVKQK